MQETLDMNERDNSAIALIAGVRTPKLLQPVIVNEEMDMVNAEKFENGVAATIMSLCHKQKWRAAGEVKRQKISRQTNCSAVSP